MPITWTPRINILKQEIADEEDILNQLKQPKWGEFLPSGRGMGGLFEPPEPPPEEAARLPRPIQPIDISEIGKARFGIPIARPPELPFDPETERTIREIILWTASTPIPIPIGQLLRYIKPPKVPMQILEGASAHARRLIAQGKTAEEAANIAFSKVASDATKTLGQVTKPVITALRGEAGMVKVPGGEPLKPKVPPEVTPAIPLLQNKLPHQMPVMSPYKARKQTQLVAKELSEHLGIVKPKMPVITETSLEKGFWRGVGDKLASIVTRTYRTERLLLRADKYIENGKMQQAFWQPIEKATNRKITTISSYSSRFLRFLKENNVDLSKLLTTKTDIDGITLTASERIGIALHHLNPQNLTHVVFGNNIPATTIIKIASSLTPEEKMVVTYLKSYFERQTPIMNLAFQRVTGKPMKIVENYFPIRIQKRALDIGEMEFNQVLIDEKKLRFATKWATSRIRKGFTLPRTGKAMQPVELDAIGIWLRHMEGIEHYKAFLPVVTDLQRLLNNPSLKRSIIQKEGLPTYQVLEQWLKDVAKTNPLGVTSQAEGMVRRLRVNAVTAVLGVNITTALKQFPSFFSGMAETGEVTALKGLFTYLKNPKETGELIKKFAPQIRRRSFEREIAEAKVLKGIAGRLTTKLSAREVFMLMTTTLDKVAVRGLWRGSFDDGLRKGLTSRAAAEQATKAIRKTQPYFGIKDVPEYWRSGEFMKALTIFTNQLNNYWNYYRFDIVGKLAAGQISKAEVARRVVETFIVPALMIGAISRSRPAENAEEIARDLGSMGLSTIPILGSWVSSSMKGFYGQQGLITLELFDKLHDFAYQTNKGAWDKMLETMPEIAGYLAGVPVAQPKRTIKALIDLASAKSDDWLELIWGAYTRREAEIKEPTVPSRPSPTRPSRPKRPQR